MHRRFLSLCVSVRVRLCLCAVLACLQVRVGACQRAACFDATVLAHCAVLVCLPACGHGRGNRAPCASWATCASVRPLAVYIYSFGSQSCATRRQSASVCSAAAPTVAAHGTSGRVRRHGLRHFFGLVVSHPLVRPGLPPPLLAAHPAMLRRRNTAFSPRGRSAANAPRRPWRPRSTSLLALEAASHNSSYTVSAQPLLSRYSKNCERCGCGGKTKLTVNA